MSGLPELQDSSIALGDGVALLTFERDDVRNALTGTAIAADLLAVLAWAEETRDTSVLIITGAGKAFCAGGNIKQMPEMSAQPAHAIQNMYRKQLQKLPQALRATKLVLIAAVNGPAVGAGCDLALLCDLRIASHSASFSEAYVNLSLVPALGGPWLLQRLVGFQRAAELVLSGRTVDAAEAYALGLVLDTVAPAALLERARELAGTIAAKPGLALGYAGQLLRRGQDQSFDDQLELAAAFQAICHKTEDHGEAVSAIVEKRRPVFKRR